MSAPQGTDIQFGYGFELAENRPAATPIDRFMRVASAQGISPAPVFARSRNMDPSRQRTRGRVVGWDWMPRFSVDPIADDALILALNHNGFWTDPSTELVASEAYRWVTRPLLNTDTQPSYVDTLATEFDVNDGKPIFASGSRITERVLRIQGRAIQQLDVMIPGTHFTFESDVVELAVNAAWTGRVLVRGLRRSGLTGDIHFKATKAGGSGVAEIKMFREGETPGATVYVVTYGEWLEVFDELDARAGVSRFDKLEIMFLDASGGGSLITLNDEWEIKATRTAASATYSTRNPLMHAGATITLDGVEYEMDSLTLTLRRARVPRNPIGSMTSTTQQENDVYEAILEYQRQADDRNIIEKLLTAVAISATIEMWGDQLSGVYDEKWKITLPNMDVSQLTRDVANAGFLPESASLEAFRSGSTSIWTEEFDVSFGTL